MLESAGSAGRWYWAFVVWCCLAIAMVCGGEVESEVRIGLLYSVDRTTPKRPLFFVKNGPIYREQSVQVPRIRSISKARHLSPRIEYVSMWFYNQRADDAAAEDLARVVSRSKALN